MRFIFGGFVSARRVVMFFRCLDQRSSPFARNHVALTSLVGGYHVATWARLAREWSLPKVRFSVYIACCLNCGARRSPHCPLRSFVLDYHPKSVELPINICRGASECFMQRATNSLSQGVVSLGMDTIISFRGRKPRLKKEERKPLRVFGRSQM